MQPELNNMVPPTEQGDALVKAQAVASIGIAVMKMLEALLPLAAKDVESAAQGLAQHFTTLIGHSSKENPDVKLATQGVVTAMQFQDRNTQMMENAARMLRHYGGLLEEMRDSGSAYCKNEVTQTADNAAKELLSGIHINELRIQFLDALADANVSLSPALMPVSEQQGNEQSIELF